MAYEYRARERAFSSHTANADYSADAAQYRFVTTDGSGGVSYTGDGALAHGVLYNKPASGEAAEVALLGDILRVRAGGTIAAGANVASDANGQAVTATSGEVILGECLEGGASGQIISVLTFSGGAGTA